MGIVMRLVVLFAVLALSSALPIHDDGVLLGEGSEADPDSAMTSQAKQDTEKETRDTQAQVSDALQANKNQIKDLATACKEEELNAEESASNKKAADTRNTVTATAASAYQKSIADANNKHVQESVMAKEDHGTEI